MIKTQNNKINLKNSREKKKNNESIFESLNYLIKGLGEK